MRQNPLGKTNLYVSEIGFGAWGIGGITPGATSYGKTNDNDSRQALWEAFQSGINFFDTSNVYGNGHSELLLGDVFLNCREKVVIATKAGFTDYQASPNYSEKSIKLSIEGSIKRLRSSWIDLLQLHNVTEEILIQNPKTIKLLERLKEEGTIRAVGVSVKSPEDAFDIINFMQVDSVQANFNMMDIRAVKSGLLKDLYKNKISFIARTPLAFGFLSGIYTGEEEFSEEDHRSRWPREQLRIWANGAKDLSIACEESQYFSLDSIALRFCISFPEITTTIPGMLTPVEVKKNILSAKLGPLSKVSIKNINSIHDKRSFAISEK